MDKKTVAVVVDYDYYVANEDVQDFVYYNKSKASMVVLITNPLVVDPVDADLWDVIIKNYKGHDHEAFKVSALEAVNAHSNLTVVVAIDPEGYDLYDEAGVLMTLDDRWFG